MPVEQPAKLQFILYGREACHLCDRLEALITPYLRAWRRRTTVTLTKRDVDSDGQWQTLYGDRIPVLTLESQVILEGRPEPGDVTRVLEALARCRALAETNRAIESEP